MKLKLCNSKNATLFETAFPSDHHMSSELEELDSNDDNKARL